MKLLALQLFIVMASVVLHPTLPMAGGTTVK
jgi:hypothetical protein